MLDRLIATINELNQSIKGYEMNGAVRSEVKQWRAIYKQLYKDYEKAQNAYLSSSEENSGLFDDEEARRTHKEHMMLKGAIGELDDAHRLGSETLEEQMRQRDKLRGVVDKVSEFLTSSLIFVLDWKNEGCLH